MSAFRYSDLSISVIIPAFNADQTIERCLISIIKAAPFKKEIIVIDDGSTDRTYEIASKYAIKLLHQGQNKGAAAAKNIGLVQASGEIVAFVDSDCIVEENYFAELISALNEAKIAVGGVGGIIYPLESGLVSDSFNIRFFGCSPVGERKIREIESLSGAASIYPKAVLLKVGGFDENINGGEDLDLNIRIRKAGYKLLLVPSAKTYHFHPAKMRQLAKKWFCYGKLLVVISRKNGLKKDVALSLGWFYGCVALLMIGFFTSQLFVWGLLVLTLCFPWLLNYGKETVKFWVRNRKIKYFVFPFIHQIVIVSRSLGVVVGTFSRLPKKDKNNSTSRKLLLNPATIKAFNPLISIFYVGTTAVLAEIQLHTRKKANYVFRHSNHQEKNSA
jgi:GT2 family glycosyltransferase